MKKIVKLIVSILLLLSSNSLFAAPVNDNCSSSTTLSVYSYCSPTSGTISGASTQKANQDVWYKFVASASNVNVSVNANFDAEVYCFSSCSNSVSFASVDNSTSGLENLNLTGLSVGSTYYIAVANYYSSTPSNPNFTICAQALVATNDVCTSALTITSGTSCNYVAGTIAGATKQYKNNDVWYKFIAQSATTNIKLSSDFDGVLSLYSACGSSSYELLTVDNSYSLEQLNLTDLNVGQVYYINVSSYSTIESYTDFNLCVTNQATLVNDNCSSASTLIQSNSCSSTIGTIANATSQYSNFDVWYKFVANSTNAQIQVTADFDAQIRTYSSCGNSTYSLKEDNTSSGTETLYLNDLVIGQTYYFSVNNYNSSVASYPEFTVCVKSSNPPVNDNCSNAINLPYSYSCNGVTSTLENATFQRENNDVWYKFVATKTSHDISVFPNFDAVINLYSGCSNSSFSYSDNSGTGGTEILSYSGLIVGATYYISVSSYGSSIPSDPSFMICNSALNSPPVNDNCVDATTLVIKNTCTKTTGSILNATTQVKNYDVWYQFVATSSTANVSVDSDFDSQIRLYSNCSDLSNILQSVDDHSGGYVETLNLTGLVTGKTYYICVSNYSSSITSTPVFDICIEGQEALAVDNELILKSVKVFPTVVDNELKIEIVNDLNFTKLEIRDLQGRLISSLNTIEPFNTINVSEWTSGLYFVSIYTKDSSQTYKVIKK
ncbi:MAG: hypothetical protein RLZZ175_1826 [Bacteroidota bacterium]|jgi:hypothetical protein